MQNQISRLFFIVLLLFAWYVFLLSPSGPNERYVWSVKLVDNIIESTTNRSSSDKKYSTLISYQLEHDADNVWRHYYDVWVLQLQVPGLINSMPALNHEKNLDFASSLYAEGPFLIFVDSGGPVCNVHNFFALSASVSLDGRVEKSILAIEVDGGDWQLVGTIESIFKGEYLTDLSKISSFSSSLSITNESSVTRSWGGLSVFPRPITFNTERSGALRSGFTLHAPICAHSRLRMAWQHTQFNPSAHLLQQGSDCVSNNLECEIAMYQNPSLLHFPGSRLPIGIMPFNASIPAFNGRFLPIPSHPNVLETWSPFRLFREAIAGGDPARSVHKCGHVSRTDEFILLEESRPGVITLFVLDFPESPYLLHSSQIQIEADWDDGQGRLSIDLESLLGPARWGDGGDVPARKECFVFGELPRGCCANISNHTEISVPATGGLYISLPMSWQKSARIRITVTGDENYGITDPPMSTLENWPPWRRLSKESEIYLCAAVVIARVEIAISAMRGAIHVLGGFTNPTVGYLQSSSLRSSGLSASMSPNVATLIDVNNMSGSLVFLSVHLRCSRQFCVEGDIRTWTDENPTPSLWTSGFEDFFGGAHAYNFVRHHHESFVAWDRYGPSQSSEHVHLFQTRTFGFEAPRFQHKFKMALEVIDRNDVFSVSTALFYGVSVQAPTVTSIFRPSDVFQRKNTYSYEISGLIEQYNLTSVVPSMGEESNGGSLLTETVLAINSGRISFTVFILPLSRSVVLRRLVDIRRAVSRASVAIDGVSAGAWISSDRSYKHIHAYWQFEDYSLPLSLTRGKSFIHIELNVTGESQAENDRSYLNFQLSPKWVEAKWEILCFPDA
jgi:hypothetical protein